MKQNFKFSSKILDKPFVLDIENVDTSIQYSMNHKDFKLWQGPILIDETCEIIFKGDLFNETVNFKIDDPDQIKKGDTFIIGGADKCKEIHDALINSGGGTELAKIAFIPAGSANPYAAGMDRMVRFRDYGPLKMDFSKVPLIDNRYNFSALNNESSFWIVPIALLDDPFTSEFPTNDPDHELNDESTFPPINEASWNDNASNMEIVQKLLDGNYSILFLTGGNQVRYVKSFFYPDGSETPLLSAIRYLHNKKGAAIAGTSAGAACMPQTMINGGGSAAAWLEDSIMEKFSDEIESPEVLPLNGANDHRLVLGKGLGFLPDFLCSDTHFFNRGRQGRLLKACSYIYKNLGIAMGIGVGEDTAAILKDHTITVIGSQQVFICFSTKENEFITHVLTSDDSINLPISSEIKSFPLPNISGTPIAIAKNKTSLHTDIFGNNSWCEFIQAQFPGQNELRGLTYSDNQVGSADTYPFDNDRPENIVMVTFSKNENTQILEKSIENTSWGARDRYYPECTKESKNLLSYSSIVVQLEVAKVINPPTFEDAERVYFDKENGIDLNDFSDNSRFYLGAILFPYKGEIKGQSFFLDYAFIDQDKDREYSAPRDYYKSDYLILNTVSAAESSIELENINTIKSDSNGIFKFALSAQTKLKVSYQGRQHYSTISIDTKELTQPLLFFSNDSY